MILLRRECMSATFGLSGLRLDMARSRAGHGGVVAVDWEGAGGGEVGGQMRWSLDDRIHRYADVWHNYRFPHAEKGLIWHLALRRYPAALTELSRQINEDRLSAADPYSALGLSMRAFRLGDPTAAYNLAMVFFNRRNLQGYRYWLRRAAQAGDEDANKQLRRFETRLPHGAAHDIRRGRPRRNYD